MNLESDKRQNAQSELDLSPRGEAREAGRQEVESHSATREPRSPANTRLIMEDTCERENLKEALQRVKDNKGSAGVDGMTVDELSAHLEEHWPVTREQLLNGTYKPKPVRRVEIPKPDGGGVRQARHSNRARPICAASSDASSATAVGPDVLQTQLRVPTGDRHIKRFAGLHYAKGPGRGQYELGAVS
jgi:hypothetical protein